MTVRTCLAEAGKRLENAGCTSARFEAEYLLMAVLDLGRVELFLRSDSELSPEEISRCQSMVTRRLQNEPLQYIVGKVEFWSRDFQVTPDVLIPRQETEFVLEQVLSLVRRQGLVCGHILDMGTGSGVIADVLAAELDCRVTAVDCSSAALEVARANISRHHLQKRVTFICSDLFSRVPRHPPFDLIVSNPPYVAESEKKDLLPEVIDYEPPSALFAGGDGLDCYRRLIPESLGYIRTGGWLCLEIGAAQEKAVKELLHGGGYHDITIHPDYAGRPRLALGRKK